MSVTTDTSTESHGHEHQIHFRIDRTEYHTNQETLTGAQLRAIPTPPIGADRDLYLVRPGADDEIVQNNEAVRMHDGLRLYTAPSQINPGRS